MLQFQLVRPLSQLRVAVLRKELLETGHFATVIHSCPESLISFNGWLLLPLFQALSLLSSAMTFLAALNGLFPTTTFCFLVSMAASTDTGRLHRTSLATLDN